VRKYEVSGADFAVTLRGGHIRNATSLSLPWSHCRARLIVASNQKRCRNGKHGMLIIEPKTRTSIFRIPPAWVPSPSIGENEMKISARNFLEGNIKDVHKGATTAHVEIELKGGETVISSITNEAVEELGLKKGTQAYAVIKASDVMIAII
jgi:molybdopterin-binding protein